MIKDQNVRSLPQVLAIAKAIIDKKKEKEFLDECAGKDTYFVVGTEDARAFLASFMEKHQINPNNVDMHNFSYGSSRCT